MLALVLVIPTLMIICYTDASSAPPSGVTAVQTGPTSIRVSWIPPSPLGDTSGYTIFYTTHSNSGSRSHDINVGYTDYTLNGLTNGETYTISIAGTAANTVPSISTETVSVGLGKPVVCILQITYILEPLWFNNYCSEHSSKHTSCGNNASNQHYNGHHH